MAANIDMFGVGGEGLGGLFMGNQMAMQRDQAELERQKAMSDMANAQSLMRARDAETAYQEQTMPDRVAVEREKALGIKAKTAHEKWQRTGEQFGQLGSMMESIPPLARPAALKQLAAQAGIGEDNPLLRSLAEVAPEQLPATLSKIGEGFYQQSTAGRAEQLKADERRQTEREKAEAAAERNRETIQGRKDIAQMMAESRRDAASIAAAARGSSGGGKTGSGLEKMSTDQAISYLERKGAIEGLSDGEQRALYNLKKLKLDQGAVRVPDTGPAVMQGAKPTTAMERTDQALANEPGRPAPKPAATPGAPKVGTELKGYRFKGGDPSKQENWEKVK